jgi:hypothetical protein
MAKETQPDNQPRCIKCGNLSFLRNIYASSQARAIHPATRAPSLSDSSTVRRISPTLVPWAAIPRERSK